MAENSMTVVHNRFSGRYGQGAGFALPPGVASNVHTREH